METLAKVAKERSTYPVNVTFRDQDGVLFEPATLVWSLTDKDGAVINSRNAVAITGGDLDSTVQILLTGADLAMSGDLPRELRIILIEATYSDTLGQSGLAFKEEIWFEVENLAKVAS